MYGYVSLHHSETSTSFVRQTFVFLMFLFTERNIIWNYETYLEEQLNIYYVDFDFEMI